MRRAQCDGVFVTDTTCAGTICTRSVYASILNAMHGVLHTHCAQCYSSLTGSVKAAPPPETVKIVSVDEFFASLKV